MSFIVLHAWIMFHCVHEPRMIVLTRFSTPVRFWCLLCGSMVLVLWQRGCGNFNRWTAVQTDEVPEAVVMILQGEFLPLGAHPSERAVSLCIPWRPPLSVFSFLGLHFNCTNFLFFRGALMIPSVSVTLGSGFCSDQNDQNLGLQLPTVLR